MSASHRPPAPVRHPAGSAPVNSGALEAATLSRVHAWEQAQQSRPGTPASPSDPDAAPAPSAESVSVDSAALLRTSPELPEIPSVADEAVAPVTPPALRVYLTYDKRGRLVLPPPLYGSREVLLHQNEMADRDGLTRIQDDATLLDLQRERKLVPLPESEALRVDYRLPANRRFSRPWTAQFLAALARDHYASFHLPLQVDSAVRTVEVQQRLQRTNGNAAPADGDTASPHLTGQAVDIAKSGLTRTEIAWMRTYLQPFIDQGKIDVEEEFKQACFHISVYRSYLSLPAHVAVASARRSASSPDAAPE